MVKNKEYLDIAINRAIELTKLTKEELNYLEGILEYKEYKKGDIVTDFNEIENYKYIVIKGYLRLYHIANGKEFTIDFYKSPELCYSMESFIMRTQSNYSLLACTDAITYRISYENFHKAMNSNKNFERLGRIITEQHYIRRINKQIDSDSLTAKERFKNVLKEWPKITDDIPQHKVATYLGIAPESLSRIKKELM